MAPVRVVALDDLARARPGGSTSTGSIAWCASATTSTPSATAAATQDISLSEGEVVADDHQLECWKHGSAFSLETGEPTSLPATQPVPVYEVERRRRRRGGRPSA